MFTGYEQKELQGLADAAKNILEGHKSLEEIADKMSKEDASNFMGAAAAAKKAGKKEFEFGGKTYPVRIDKDVADEIAEVDEASKPDFLDIDKDGDKKEPMAKAAKDKEQKECVSREDFKPHKMYDPKTGTEVMANTYDDHLKYDKMGYVHDKPTKSEANEFEAPFAEDSEKLKEFAKTVEVPQFDTDQDAIEKLKNKHDIEITEGKMKELSGYIEAGLTAKEIAKVMKLKFDGAMEKFLKKMGAK
tara:strand:+ start:203 stop:940 length:738 start_codon:yes stop_codon:yes gene_type:complete